MEYKKITMIAFFIMLVSLTSFGVMADTVSSDEVSSVLKNAVLNYLNNPDSSSLSSSDVVKILNVTSNMDEDVSIDLSNLSSNIRQIYLSERAEIPGCGYGKLITRNRPCICNDELFMNGKQKGFEGTSHHRFCCGNHVDKGFCESSGLRKETTVSGDHEDMILDEENESADTNPDEEPAIDEVGGDVINMSSNFSVWLNYAGEEVEKAVVTEDIFIYSDLACKAEDSYADIYVDGEFVKNITDLFSLGTGEGVVKNLVNFDRDFQKVSGKSDKYLYKIYCNNGGLQGTSDPLTVYPLDSEEKYPRCFKKEFCTYSQSKEECLKNDERCDWIRDNANLSILQKQDVIFAWYMQGKLGLEYNELSYIQPQDNFVNYAEKIEMDELEGYFDGYLNDFETKFNLQSPRKGMEFVYSYLENNSVVVYDEENCICIPENDCTPGETRCSGESRQVCKEFKNGIFWITNNTCGSQKIDGAKFPWCMEKDGESYCVNRNEEGFHFCVDLKDYDYEMKNGVATQTQKKDCREMYGDREVGELTRERYYDGCSWSHWRTIENNCECNEDNFYKEIQTIMGPYCQRQTVPECSNKSKYVKFNTPMGNICEDKPECGCEKGKICVELKEIPKKCEDGQMIKASTAIGYFCEPAEEPSYPACYDSDDCNNGEKCMMRIFVSPSAESNYRGICTDQETKCIEACYNGQDCKADEVCLKREVNSSSTGTDKLEYNNAGYSYLKGVCKKGNVELNTSNFSGGGVNHKENWSTGEDSNSNKSNDDVQYCSFVLNKNQEWSNEKLEDSWGQYDKAPQNYADLKTAFWRGGVLHVTDSKNYYLWDKERKWFKNGSLKEAWGYQWNSPYMAKTHDNLKMAYSYNDITYFISPSYYYSRDSSVWRRGDIYQLWSEHENAPYNSLGDLKSSFWGNGILHITDSENYYLWNPKNSPGERWFGRGLLSEKWGQNQKAPQKFDSVRLGFELNGEQHIIAECNDDFEEQTPKRQENEQHHISTAQIGINNMIDKIRYSGDEDIVQFCGINSAGIISYQQAYCNGSWTLNPLNWHSKCDTGWKTDTDIIEGQIFEENSGKCKDSFVYPEKVNVNYEALGKEYNTYDGFNSVVEFCGVKDGDVWHGKAICLGHWDLDLTEWQSNCDTDGDVDTSDWIFEKEDFYKDPECNERNFSPETGTLIKNNIKVAK